MRMLISIPYNIACHNKGCVGFDAYFWDKVSKPTMRVALIRKESDLKSEPAGNPLSPNIDVEKQLNDLRELVNTYKPRLRFSLLVSILRFFTFSPRAPIEVEHFDGAIAAAICKAIDIDRMRPAGRVEWFYLKLDVADNAIKEIYDDNYRRLFEADEGFRQALQTVVSLLVTTRA